MSVYRENTSTEKKTSNIEQGISKFEVFGRSA